MDDDDENFATHKHRANSCEFFLTVELVTRFTCQQLRANFLFTGSDTPHSMSPSALSNNNTTSLTNNHVVTRPQFLRQRNHGMPAVGCS